MSTRSITPDVLDRRSFDRAKLSALERAQAQIDKESEQLAADRARLQRDRVELERDRENMRVSLMAECETAIIQAGIARELKAYRLKVLQEAADACKRAAEERPSTAGILACLACAEEIESQMASDL